MSAGDKIQRIWLGVDVVERRFDERGDGVRIVIFEVGLSILIRRASGEANSSTKCLIISCSNPRDGWMA